MPTKAKHTGLGIALGAAFGTALGVAAGHMAIWLAVGIAIGMALGSSLRPRQDLCPQCEAVHKNHKETADRVG